MTFVIYHSSMFEGQKDGDNGEFLFEGLFTLTLAILFLHAPLLLIPWWIFWGSFCDLSISLFFFQTLVSTPSQWFFKKICSWFPRQFQQSYLISTVTRIQMALTSKSPELNLSHQYFPATRNTNCMSSTHYGFFIPFQPRTSPFSSSHLCIH